MHFGRGEADGFAVAGRAHRFDVGGDTARDGTAGLRPTQKAADSLQAAVDGGCLELTQGEHVLAPGNQIVLGQPRQLGQAAVQGGVPGTELEQVVAVAASGGGRPILGGEAVKPTFPRWVWSPPETLLLSRSSVNRFGVQPWTRA